MVETVHPDDFELAMRAVAGDASAIADVERMLAPVVKGTFASMNLQGFDEQEALQLVREHLFVGRGGGAGKIGEYAGRGKLKSWLRVVVARVLLNRAAAPAHERPAEQDVLERLLGAGNDVELAYMKAVYQDEFRAAFGDALRSLGARDRTLIRLAFLESLTIDELATLYRVHRSSAARWVVRAEQTLFSSIREKVKARLDIDEAEYESILRMVKSRLDFTFDSYIRS